MDLSALFDKAAALVPVTVAAAVLLFLVKESFEFFRRRGERKRKLSAIQSLLAEEIERNYWFVKSFFDALEIIKRDDDGDEDFLHFRLHVARNGSEHLRAFYRADGKLSSSRWLPKLHDEQYKKLLLPLAELDRKQFESVSGCYAELTELSNLRSHLIDYLAGETIFQDQESTRSFLVSLIEERNDYVSDLAKTYKILVGRELKNWRLR